MCPSVHIVSQKQVVNVGDVPSCGRRAILFEQPHQVTELTVQVTKELDRGCTTLALSASFKCAAMSFEHCSRRQVHKSVVRTWHGMHPCMHVLHSPTELYCAIYMTTYVCVWGGVYKAHAMAARTWLIKACELCFVAECISQQPGCLLSVSCAAARWSCSVTLLLLQRGSSHQYL